MLSARAGAAITVSWLHWQKWALFLKREKFDALFCGHCDSVLFSYLSLTIPPLLFTAPFFFCASTDLRHTILFITEMLSTDFKTTLMSYHIANWGWSVVFFKSQESLCNMYDKNNFSPSNSARDPYLSMFLLLARRRATMPSLASASRENGSIPCAQNRAQSVTPKNHIPHLKKKKSIQCPGPMNTCRKNGASSTAEV